MSHAASAAEGCKKEKPNPFLMPEGYVEDFTANLMAMIDAGQQSAAPTGVSVVSGRAVRVKKPAFHVAVRWLTGVAAVIAFFFAFTYGVNSQSAAVQTDGGAVVASQEMASSNYDMVYDYMMMDDLKIYDYATNNE